MLAGLSRLLGSQNAVVVAPMWPYKVTLVLPLSMSVARIEIASPSVACLVPSKRPFAAPSRP